MCSQVHETHQNNKKLFMRILNDILIFFKKKNDILL